VRIDGRLRHCLDQSHEVKRNMSTPRAFEFQRVQEAACAAVRGNDGAKRVRAEIFRCGFEPDVASH